MIVQSDVGAECVVDLERFEEIARLRHDEFVSAEPYPHIIIDDFLPQEVADQVEAEFGVAAEGWNHYHHYNEKKMGLTDISKMGPMTQKVFRSLQSQPFIDVVQRLTGIENLIPDPELDGSGMHETRPGGHLNIHTDFLTHTINRSWHRQLNLLVYLNKDWGEGWGGDLEIWDKTMTNRVATVPPIFNRCVMFNTIPKSYHGHPHPLTCPPDRARRSILLYYYQDEGAIRALEPTDYQPLPTDSIIKKAMVSVDNSAVRAYSVLKRYFRMRDNGIIDKVLKKF